MIRRKKTTIFTDAKETTTIRELKKIIQGNLLNSSCFDTVKLEVFFENWLALCIS
jgi:hypothetical protein